MAKEEEVVRQRENEAKAMKIVKTVKRAAEKELEQKVVLALYTPPATSTSRSPTSILRLWRRLGRARQWPNFDEGRAYALKGNWILCKLSLVAALGLFSGAQAMPPNQRG
jgi:Flp pilus assembly protein TadB